MRVSGWVRVLLTAGLVLVWSMPAVVAVQVWYWMTNFQNGILNYVLTELGLGDYFQHDWYGSPFSQLAMVTVLIVWGAIPFVTVTVYAGLAQVPRELVEAAQTRTALRVMWEMCKSNGTLTPAIKGMIVQRSQQLPEDS